MALRLAVTVMKSTKGRKVGKSILGDLTKTPFLGCIMIMEGVDNAERWPMPEMGSGVACQQTRKSEKFTSLI